MVFSIFPRKRFEFPKTFRTIKCISLKLILNLFFDVRIFDTHSKVKNLQTKNGTCNYL